MAAAANWDQSESMHRTTEQEKFVRQTTTWLSGILRQISDRTQNRPCLSGNSLFVIRSCFILGLLNTAFLSFVCFETAILQWQMWNDWPGYLCINAFRGGKHLQVAVASQETRSQVDELRLHLVHPMWAHSSHIHVNTQTVQRLLCRINGCSLKKHPYPFSILTSVCCETHQACIVGDLMLFSLSQTIPGNTMFKLRQLRSYDLVERKSFSVILQVLCLKLPIWHQTSPKQPEAVWRIVEKYKCLVLHCMSYTFVAQESDWKLDLTDFAFVFEDQLTYRSGTASRDDPRQLSMLKKGLCHSLQNRSLKLLEHIKTLNSKPKDTSLSGRTMHIVPCQV